MRDAPRPFEPHGWAPRMALWALLGLLGGCVPDTGTDGPPETGEGEGVVAVELPDSAPEPAPALPEFREEVEAVSTHPQVQAALDFIQALEERSRDDLIRLTEIPAPPFMEDERGRAFAQMLREAGADSVWTDGEGNVIGLRRGTDGSRTVALDGHLDTVFPPETDVTVQIRGDTLYAPGVGDDTRGLIVVRNVLEAMVTHDLRTEADLLFVGTVGEEGLGDLSGVKHLFGPEGPGIDAFIAVDGGDETRVVNQGVGSLRYRVTFQGPGGHSWGAFGLGNPHHALGAAIRHFVPAADAHTSSGPRTSYSVGRIGGGTSVNSIPFESWMEVDMRSLDPESLGRLDGIFHESMQAGLDEQNAIVRQGPPLTVDVARVGDRPAGTLDPYTPLVQRALAVVRHQGGEPALGSGSTNANTPISMGIPSVTIGRGGDGGNAHALDEWWLDVDAHLAAQNALLLVLMEGGFPGD
ncbi:MAG: M20/M25/M40 family metallo-hydrolase [Gemmatimonadota bacterium]